MVQEFGYKVDIARLLANNRATTMEKAKDAKDKVVDAGEAAVGALEKKLDKQGFSSARGSRSATRRTKVAQEASNVGSDAAAFLAGGARGMQAVMGSAAKKWAAPAAGAVFAFKPKEVAALVSKAAGVAEVVYKTVLLKIARDFLQIMGVVFSNFKVRACGSPSFEDVSVASLARPPLPGPARPPPLSAGLRPALFPPVPTTRSTAHPPLGCAHASRPCSADCSPLIRARLDPRARVRARRRLRATRSA